MPETLDIKYGIRLAANVVNAATLVAVRPTIVTWSRLEPLPYNEDLTNGLQAQIADPMWMLARQWQFAEFQGEDAGSPIWVRLEGENARINQYQPANGPAVNYEHLEMPLEVMVEREAIRGMHPRMAAEAGEHLLRLLTAQGVTGVRGDLRTAYGLEIADEALHAPDADPKGKAWQTLFAGRALDGERIAADLRAQANLDGSLNGLPPVLQELDTANAGKVRPVAEVWLRWYNAHISEGPSPISEAWIQERQEYSLGLTANLDGRTLTLKADEYTDGRLDWYSFSVTTGPGGADDAETLTYNPMMPAPVRYPGMPADRYWEFEDARVSLGSLEAGPTDLGRMLLAEYGLVYGNDWFVIPVELPVGSVFRVKSLTIRDTFGVTANARASRNFDGTRWTMFLLSSAPEVPSSLQDLFFLPPALPYRLEGDPLEEVALFRDEMANMAWAVEHKVQGASGMPMDRRMEPPAPAVHQRIDPADISAELIYRLMTPVADQWLPLVPVPPKNNLPLFRFSIGLERRTLLRTLPDGSLVEIHPRGILMRSDLSRPVEDEPPLRLFEEEVPRDGAMVQRAFQYTRWLDGRRYLWVGRQKRVGRGEGASGLRFDISTFTAERTAPISEKKTLNKRRIRRTSVLR